MTMTKQETDKHISVSRRRKFARSQNTLTAERIEYVSVNLFRNLVYTNDKPSLAASIENSK